MTNLDSVLKSRDITLPAKVHLVKAMVFPIVMYGCDDWSIKKAECQKTDTIKRWGAGGGKEALILGKQNGAATSKDSLAVSYEAKQS